MSDIVQNPNEIRQYLLGQLVDETAVDRIDERLFGDDEFAEHVAFIEDSLIDEFVRGELSPDDSEALKTRAASSKDLQRRIALSTVLIEKATVLTKDAPAAKPSLLEAFAAFIRQPIVAGAFAVGIVLIIASVVFFRIPTSGDIADLRAIYKNERPTQARISDFDYAALVTRRGAAEERESARLRRIELSLLDQTEKNPTSRSLHDLGKFYLSQLRLKEATAALDRSVAIDAKNVGALSDLGSVYFERARTENETERFKTLAIALDKFAAAVELSPTDTTAAFNYAQTLQSLGLTNEAIQAWKRYLELDGKSGWADEARKALEKLEQPTSSRTKDQAVEDMVAAVEAGDTELVWKIQSNTREMVSDLWLPRQLARKMIEAKARGDGAVAGKYLNALKQIGELERSRNADFFVAEIASFYEKETDHFRLSTAEAMLTEGFVLLSAKKVDLARAKFAESRDLFSAAGDRWRSMLADLWVAHMLTDLSKLDESDAILDRLSAECAERKYVWLGIHVADWKSNNHLLRNEIGRSTAINRALLKRAESIGDRNLINRINITLANKYDSLGDPEQTLRHLSGVSIDIMYGQEGPRRWRRNSDSSDAFLSLGKPRVAELFAKEALANALSSSQLSRSQAVDDTLRDLIGIYTYKGDFAKALQVANDARDRALSTEDPVLRSKLLRYATIIVADLERRIGNFESALSSYDEVIALQAQDAQVQIDQYEANRGRTLALIGLGRPAEDQLAKATKLSEQFRSRILDQESRASFIAGERELAEAVITDAIKNGNSRKAFEVAEASRARSLLDMVGGETSIAKLEEQFPTVSSVVDLPELQKDLPSNVQLVVYSTLKDRLGIWHVTADQFNYVESPIGERSLESEINGLIDVVVNRLGSKDEVSASSSKLYSILLTPLEKHLDRQKQIVVVPDGPIGKVPFAMLMNSSGRYLIEDMTAAYSPSSSVFVRTTKAAKHRSPAVERLLAVGDPAFDRSEQPSLDALPSAAEEARSIATLYQNPSTLIGAEATRSRFLAQLPSANIVHFAGHYVASETSPANSRLVLAKEADQSDLRLDELAKLRLDRSMLVILSACETNSENIIPGEGSTGIAQKFLAIGAPLVIAGNWKIDSESTAEIMKIFHHNRRMARMTSIDALRHAQLAALRDKKGEPRPPFYWAAFAAIGGSTAY